jgi:two-component system response regulator RegA
MDTAFLIIDDDDIFAATLARALGRRGFAVQVAHTGAEAMRLAAQTAFAYVTIDLHLAHAVLASGATTADSGLHLIAPLRQLLPRARMLILTGYGSIATAVQAVKSGADEYLTKPANVDAILQTMGGERAEQLARGALAQPAPLSVARLEWEHIQRVLAEHDGNISATARALNMHRRTLQRKLGKRPVSR